MGDESRQIVSRRALPEFIIIRVGSPDAIAVLKSSVRIESHCWRVGVARTSESDVAFSTPQPMNSGIP